MKFHLQNLTSTYRINALLKALQQMQQTAAEESVATTGLSKSTEIGPSKSVSTNASLDSSTSIGTTFSSSTFSNVSTGLSISTSTTGLTTKVSKSISTNVSTVTFTAATSSETNKVEEVNPIKAICDGLCS